MLTQLKADLNSQGIAIISLSHQKILKTATLGLRARDLHSLNASGRPSSGLPVCLATLPLRRIKQGHLEFV